MGEIASSFVTAGVIPLLAARLRDARWRGGSAALAAPAAVLPAPAAALAAAALAGAAVPLSVRGAALLLGSARGDAALVTLLVLPLGSARCDAPLVGVFGAMS